MGGALSGVCGQLIEQFGLGPEDLVVEAGSNDGTLLKFFAARGIRVLGIEPSGNVAAIARLNTVPTLTAFFNEETARQHWPAWLHGKSWTAGLRTGGRASAGRCRNCDAPVRASRLTRP